MQGVSIRNVLPEHAALPRVFGINHNSFVWEFPRKCTIRTRCFAKDFRQGGRLSSFKEKLLRGKAITSLQFLSEPTNIVKSQEASLDWTLCSGKYFNPFSQWIFFGKTQVWIIQPSYLLWEKTGNMFPALNTSPLRKKVFQVSYQPILLNIF